MPTAPSNCPYPADHPVVAAAAAAAHLVEAAARPVDASVPAAVAVAHTTGYQTAAPVLAVVSPVSYSVMLQSRDWRGGPGMSLVQLSGSEALLP